MPAIWLGLVALEGSIFWGSLRIPPFETMIFLICVFSILSEGSGGVNNWSGFENTLQNCLLKMFALGQ